jgi:hypothetical protein
MEEKISGLPSLPPDLDGKIFGFLKIEVGNIVWLKAPYDPSSVLIRVKFWGDKSDGILVRTADSKKQPYSNKAEYTIRNTQPLFIKYLCDMSVLTLDVIDSAKRRLIGAAKVNLKLYLRRDESAAKGKLASNSRFSNIEVEGAFPIMRAGDNADKLGELEISIHSDFHKWKNEVRNSKELLDSFQMNELRAEFDDSLPTRPVMDEVYNPDDRIPNSYALRTIREEQRPPIKPHDASQDVIKLSKSAVKKISDPRKSPAHQPYRSEPPKPSYIPEPEARYEPLEEKPLNSSRDLELEAITKRAEMLRKRMEESAKDNYYSILHGNSEPKQVDLPLPTLAEIEAMELPVDPTMKFKPAETDEIQLEKPYAHLTDMKQLIINITTLTVLCDKSLVKDKFIYLECILPVPTLSHPLSNAKTNEDKKGVFIRTDSFKVSHKGGYDNVFTFNHESVHDLGIGEGVYGKLANQNVRFRLVASDGKKGDIELGKAEIMWEKILISPGFSYNVVLEFVNEENAKKKVRKAVAGRLTCKFSLVAEKGKAVEEEKPTEVRKENLETATLESKPIEKPQEELVAEDKLYQLFLYIDSACQLQSRPDGTFRNIYISYKTFPQNDKIKTPVLWNYEDSASIDHKIVLPIISSASLIEKLYNGLLVLEVWDKVNPSTEELLGLVKLPLKLFATSLSSGQATTGVYPLIAFDEYRAINNLKTGQDVGYLKLCLAMGSVAQVHRLEMAHTGKKESKEPGREERGRAHSPNKETVEESKIVDYSSRILPKDLTDNTDVLNQSVESISDIAAILNSKAKEESMEPEPIRTMTPIKRPEIIAREEIRPVSKESEPVPSKLPEPTRRSLTDLATELRSNLLYQDIDVLSLLSKSDLANKNYVSRDFLLNLLSRISPTYSSDQLHNLITMIVSDSSTSTPQHIYKPDILSFLNLPSVAQPNTAHVFNLHILELFSSRIISTLPSRSCYIKVLFPLEDGYIESDLLEPNDGKSIPLNLKSKHTYTLPSYTNLTEHMSSTPGICIYLCRNMERSHEMVIAKAILPVEEILEMEEGSKINRVLCLYADNNEAVRSFGHDIIGKIKLNIQYSTFPSYEKLSKSSELVIEKETRVDRLIPRNNLLTVFIDKSGDLQKAARYFRSQGLYLDNSEVYVRINVFSEDVRLSNMHGLLLSSKLEYSETVNFTERLQMEINIDDAILDYLKCKAAFVELVSLLPNNEEFVIGSARVNLVPLLLNNLLAGEFALLNDYGQFMGWVNLSISMLLEDARPTLYTHSRTNKETIPRTSRESPIPSPKAKSKTVPPTKPQELQEKDNLYLKSNVARDIEARMMLWNQSLEYQADEDVKKLHARNMKELDNILSGFDFRRNVPEKPTTLQEKCEKFIRHHSPGRSEQTEVTFQQKCERFIRHHSPLHSLDTFAPTSKLSGFEDPNIVLQNTLKQTEDLLMNLKRKQIEISQTIKPYEYLTSYEEPKASIFESSTPLNIEQLNADSSPQFPSYDPRESMASNTSYITQNRESEYKYIPAQPEKEKESMDYKPDNEFYDSEYLQDSTLKSYKHESKPEADIYSSYKHESQPEADIYSSYKHESQPETNIYSSYAHQYKPEADIYSSYKNKSQPEADIYSTYKHESQPETNIYSSYAHQYKPETDIYSSYAPQYKPETDIYSSYAPQSKLESGIYSSYPSQYKPESTPHPISSNPEAEPVIPELDEWDHTKVQDILSIIREAELIAGPKHDILEDQGAYSLPTQDFYRPSSPCSSPPSTHSEPLTFSSYSHFPAKRPTSPNPDPKSTRFPKDPEIDRIANIMKRKF